MCLSVYSLLNFIFFQHLKLAEYYFKDVLQKIVKQWLRVLIKFTKTSSICRHTLLHRMGLQILSWVVIPLNPQNNKMFQYLKCNIISISTINSIFIWYQISVIFNHNINMKNQKIKWSWLWTKINLKYWFPNYGNVA